MKIYGLGPDDMLTIAVPGGEVVIDIQDGVAHVLMRTNPAFELVDRKPLTAGFDKLVSFHRKTDETDREGIPIRVADHPYGNIEQTR